MKRIRLLIADRSPTTRLTVSRLLERDQELEVVGTAASGRIALAKLHDRCPDVLVLDVELAEMGGLQTLAAVRESHPLLPVIMFSKLTQRGSEATVEALMLGANDYVCKPEAGADFERCVLGELSAKIKSLVASAPASPRPTRESSERSVATSPPLAPPPLSHVAQIVAIAASTGGPHALARLLSSLPASFTTPIVVVQHMASGFTKSFAESLCRQTGRDVREADSVQPLDAAAVWLASSGRHLVVTRKGTTVQVAPHSGPPENECCPSADVLFRSVAAIFGPSGLAVVLTGIGCDGLAGCRSIRQGGGSILVQDQASSVAWGMPGQVATAGLADLVLPLSGLSAEICRRTAGTRARR